MYIHSTPIPHHILSYCVIQQHRPCTTFLWLRLVILDTPPSAVTYAASCVFEVLVGAEIQAMRFEYPWGWRYQKARGAVVHVQCKQGVRR